VASLGARGIGSRRSAAALNGGVVCRGASAAALGMSRSIIGNGAALSAHRIGGALAHLGSSAGLISSIAAAASAARRRRSAKHRRKRGGGGGARRPLVSACGVGAASRIAAASRRSAAAAARHRGGGAQRLAAAAARIGMSRKLLA